MNKVYCLLAAGIIAAAGAFAIVSDGAEAQDGSPTATTGTATTGSPTTGTGTPGAGSTASPVATTTTPAGSPTGGAGGTATRAAPVGAPDTGTGMGGGEGNEMLWMIALLPVVAFGAFYAASRVRGQ